MLGQDSPWDVHPSRTPRSPPPGNLPPASRLCHRSPPRGSPWPGPTSVFPLGTPEGSRSELLPGLSSRVFFSSFKYMMFGKKGLGGGSFCPPISNLQRVSRPCRCSCGPCQRARGPVWGSRSPGARGGCRRGARAAGHGCPACLWGVSARRGHPLSRDLCAAGGRG